MISWMQKHNKFLVVTIWIATISFIFMGGTYGFSYSIKSNSIGHVGDQELNRDRFHMEYQNLYSRYNQMFQGKFDEEQAKKMGLQQQVIDNMAAQAKILNLAESFGIVASDQEVAEKLASIPAFQKDGQFDRSIYDNYLTNSRLSTKTFEGSLRDNVIIEKTLKLLDVNGLQSEQAAFTTPFEIGDQIKYIVFSSSDVNITVDDAKLKEFWELRKDQYQTSKQYSFDMVTTSTDDINLSDEELQKHYEANSFNYIGAEGKLLSFDEAKEKVAVDLKLEKSKKSANLQYIAFKKGEIEKEKTLTYDLNDFRLPRDVWSEVSTKFKGDILKPKVVSKQYTTIKISDIIEPRTKTFEEAKNEVTSQYKADQAQEKLSQLAEEKLAGIDTEAGELSDYLTLNNISKQNLGLNEQEIANFSSKLFTSEEEKGIISIGNKAIVYKIVDQKLVTIDQNETERLEENANQAKLQTFQSNLMEELDKRYPTELYK